MGTMYKQRRQCSYNKLTQNIHTRQMHTCRLWLVWSGLVSLLRCKIYSVAHTPSAMILCLFFSKSTSSHFSFLAASSGKVTDSFVLVGLLHVGDSVYLWFFSTIAL